MEDISVYSDRNVYIGDQMYAYTIHSCTHAPTQEYTHQYTHTNAYTALHTHSNTYTQQCIYTVIHTHSNAHTRTHTTMFAQLPAMVADQHDHRVVRETSGLERSQNSESKRVMP